MAVPVLHIAFFIARLVSKKARLRHTGVQKTWHILAELPRPLANAKRFWFHAASMGEFEQVKPIIELIKSHAPDSQIIVSFFSPSGYEHQKNYPLADAVVYLPLDSKCAARCFIDAVQPSCAVFARYDLWYNILMALKDRSIPSVLVCATLNENNPLLRFGAGREYLRRVYNSLATIYTAGASETAKFGHLDITASVATSADTRFDRIAEQVTLAQAEGTQAFGLSEDFFREDDVVLVLGSSWKPDEDCILEAMKHLEHPLQERLRLIIAPHEPTEETVIRLREILPQSEYLSVLEERLGSAVAVQQSPPQQTNPQHIIVDSIGKLLRLYALADAAYIGGGFGAGVHSVTEPAGYGIPLASGANIGRARDAIALHDKGALTVFRSVEDAYEWLSMILQSPNICKQQGSIAHEYIHSGLGWSEYIAKTVILVTKDSSTYFDVA